MITEMKKEEEVHVDGIRILRLPEVVRKIGISKPSIYRLMKENRFPRPIKIGRSAVGWRNDLLEDFILNRPDGGSSSGC